MSREPKSYLIFTLYDSHYAIEATLVREIFLLPELTPIADAPNDIVGVLNLRSKIVPFIHLAKRLGYPIEEFNFSDNAIVLEWDSLHIGMIVNTVREVMIIEPTAIELEIDYGQINEGNARFISDIAQVGSDIIMLLNPEQLIRNPESVEALIADQNNDDFVPELELQSSMTEETDESLLQPLNSEALEVPTSEAYLTYPALTTKVKRSFYDLYCPSAAPTEREIFRQRTENLRQSITERNPEVTGQIPLAVIGLNGECFGIDLESIREFITIRSFTTIPCSPNSVIGIMNLQGEIVTLFDIRRALNLPLAPVKPGARAVVIDVDDVVAGLPIDEVFDVIYLHPEEMNTVPIAVNSGRNEYLRGTAPYFEKMMTIIDLPKIFRDGYIVAN